MAKPGKYAHVIGKLPRVINIGSDAADPGYQAKVDVVKQAILEATEQVELPKTLDDILDGADARMKLALRHLQMSCAGKRHGSSFVQAWLGVRKMKDMINAWESSVNLVLESFGQLMVDQLENEGVNSLKGPGGGVNFHLEPYTKVTDKVEVLTWVLADPILKDGIQFPWQRMNKICKDMLIAGEDLPKGVEIVAKTVVRRAGEE